MIIIIITNDTNIIITTLILITDNVIMRRQCVFWIFVVSLEQIQYFLFEKCCDPQAGQSLYRTSLLPTGFGIRVGSSGLEEDFYHVYNHSKALT